ncbi:MAG TPA: LamG-like jellyroll fold domain-containing protein [Bacteroidia bacterium]
MKIKITTLFFALSLYFSLSAQVDLKDGLMLHLPFSGNARDTSGNERHGTVYNADLGFDRFGNPNSAYYFNSNSSYIQIPSTGLTNKNYTYSLWVKADVIPAKDKYTYPFSIGGVGGGQNVALCNNSMTGWSGGVYNDGTPATSLVAAGIQSEVGVWYHLILVRTNSKIKLYINGVLNTNEQSYGNADATTGGTNPSYGTQVYAWIGTRSLLSEFFFKGLVDDVRVYDRVINDDEIEALFNENKKTSLTSLPTIEQASCFPNPSSGNFTIDLNDHSYSAYRVFNAYGQEIFNGNIDQSSTAININLNGYSDGFYHVQLIGNINQNIRLILKR